MDGHRGRVAHFFPMLVGPVKDLLRAHDARQVSPPIGYNDRYLLHIKCLINYR
jgi:hypothetical protein